MYSSIYIEDGVRDLPRAVDIAGRYPNARQIACSAYSEVFNRSSQDFRLQKRMPSLILAKKRQNHVLPAPEGYGVGSIHNYYFSTMLNCVYDCRYCFLQGMFRSAHHVIFVNYDDFWSAIAAKIDAHQSAEKIYFFSGYDCDSLAMEPLAGLAEYFVEAFRAHPNAMLELRTKSTQVRSLLCRDSLPNVIVAFSFTPQRTSDRLEHKVPGVSKRIEAMTKLQSAGWPIGLRFDPLIFQRSYQSEYRELFDSVFEKVNGGMVHSVSVGAFRLPHAFHRKMSDLYPDEPFLALPFENASGMVSYPQSTESEMIGWCMDTLGDYVDSDRIFRATVG